MPTLVLLVVHQKAPDPEQSFLIHQRKKLQECCSDFSAMLHDVQVMLVCIHFCKFTNENLPKYSNSNMIEWLH